MSLATTVLLAFLPAIVRPKPEPEKSDRGPGLRWAREKRLEAERDALKEELEYARLERDSARRRLDDAWDMLARLGNQRIGERLEVGAVTPASQAQYAAMQQMQQAIAYQQGLANPQQQAAYQQMQAMNAQNFAGLAGVAMAREAGWTGELIDCTGGGRARYLAGVFGAIGGA